METKNENVATLCNFEVMEKLKKIRAAKTMKKGELATITYETLCYLESTPCKKMSDSSVRNCMRELKPFVLRDLERLMLVNTPPGNAVELQLIISDSEERLTEEEVDKILEIIARNFPHVKEVKKDSEDDDSE
ncbi:DNA-directed RNA polymerase III subunit RPC9 [Coccinella septempunctata]|uniref:DNA-directed RNA polymerase III subunit RPC9 n=1 Tax=Coccinella septempunctata TaxID=41139 RepID=UPI001D08A738|nr:DNA-directed RNA polymerase III subunit RPC9 [Coccinella septempunctata]